LTSLTVEADQPPAQCPALIVWFPAADRGESRNELLNAALDQLDVERELSHRTVFEKWEFSN
jgi:hypothetical protein